MKWVHISPAAQNIQVQYNAWSLRQVKEFMYVLTYSLCNLKDDESECGWMFILLYRCLDVRVFVFLSKI